MASRRSKKKNNDNDQDDDRDGDDDAVFYERNGYINILWFL